MIIGKLVKKFFEKVPIGTFNKYAALIHLTALVVFSLLLLLKLRKTFQVSSVYRQTPQANPSENVYDTVDRHQLLRKYFGVNVVHLILYFFAFTIFFHFLYWKNSGPDGWYTRFIAEGHNPVRWAEYAISAGIMTLIICFVGGNVREINGTWAVTVAITSLMIQGAIVERQLILPNPDKETIKYATIAGWTLLLTQWVPIAHGLFTVIRDIRAINPQYANRVPTWIPLFTFFQLYQFSQFGFIQLKQVRAFFKGVPIPFDLIEKEYIVNSLTTKLVLGAFVAYGLLDRQRRNDRGY